MIEFQPFPKIPRLNREIVITEKIDGTNGVIHVADDLTVTAGSRNRWLTIEKDNFGFAKWVAENAEELAELAELLAKVLVRIGSEGFEVTSMGWFFVRAVAMVFDRHLRERSTQARYSRIV